MKSGEPNRGKGSVPIQSGFSQPGLGLQILRRCSKCNENKRQAGSTTRLIAGTRFWRCADCSPKGKPRDLVQRQDSR